MNTHTIKGNWTRIKGAVRETWGELTNDDVDQIAGEREQLIGKLQERYGKALDIVEQEVKLFEDKMSLRK